MSDRLNKPTRILQAIGGLDSLVLCRQLTLILLLLYAPRVWYLIIPLQALCILGLVYRPLARQPGFWLIAAALMASATVLNWYFLDNHKYLLCYWVIAMWIIHEGSPDERRGALAHNAHWLLGLTMVFATLWKIMEPPFLNGSVFEFLLLTDARFEYVARWFGEMTQYDLASNRDVIDELKRGYLHGREMLPVQLATSKRIAPLAVLLSWWTILIEGAIALVYMLPIGRLHTTRHVFVLVFAASTYLVAPVKGFGWLLMILGIAQCGQTERGFKLAYLSVFLLIHFYVLPFGKIIDITTSRW